MMPRSPDLAIYVVTDRQTNKQTDKTIALPLAHARGVINTYTETGSQETGKARELVGNPSPGSPGKDLQLVVVDQCVKTNSSI